MSNLADDAQVGLGVRERWTEIRNVADRLLQHAQDREWKAVGELHSLRDELIQSFFAEPASASEANAVREGILAVLESDQELLRLRRGYECKRPANVIQFRQRASAKRPQTNRR